MAEVDPNLVPSVAPGTLFSRLTTDTTIAIRFLVALDPVHFESLNRPVADVSLRQLIIAKTLDQINLRLGHQALFPFVVQPTLPTGTGTIDLPALIWDQHVSLPKKWQDMRLAKVKRISGANPPSTGTGDFTGRLRFVFTAEQELSTTEVAVFVADYVIDSTLTFQRSRIAIPALGEEAVQLDPGESETIDGFITFRTLDTSDTVVQTFLQLLAPPIDGTDADADGEFDTPTVIEISDTVAGGSAISNDFSLVAISHGTGILTNSASVSIPVADSDLTTILTTLNFPFGIRSNRTSASPSGIIIPAALFEEFNMSVPAGDEPTSDTSGTFFPVFISRIERLDDAADTLKFFFATFLVDTASIVPVEFATMILARTGAAGTIVEISAANSLFKDLATVANWSQEFGRGHVVLSAKWGAASSEVTDFFDRFLTIIDSPPDAVFTEESTRLSSWSLSRVPRFSPTAGQAAALRGSRAGASNPSSTSRYVVEGDQGLGDQVDFATATALPEDKRENASIERFGHTGALLHRTVRMVIDQQALSVNGGGLVYDDDILPRLTILFGREPQYGDQWDDGTRIKSFNGDTWVG